MAPLYSMQSGEHITAWQLIGEPDPNEETPLEAYEAQQRMMEAVAARQRRKAVN